MVQFYEKQQLKYMKIYNIVQQLYSSPYTKTKLPSLVSLKTIISALEKTILYS